LQNTQGSFNVKGVIQNPHHNPDSGTNVSRIANKFGCTIEQAEAKIAATMNILQIDREIAEAFLLEVRTYGSNKTDNR